MTVAPSTGGPQLTVDDVLPPGPLRPDGPRVAVLVSLNLPGASPAVTALMRRFTITALAELDRQGASLRVVDTSAPARPDPGEIAAHDGVLVLGGGDADPALYGVTGPVRGLYGVDRDTDEADLLAIRTTLHRRTPLLGICRGAQVLNLAQGGSLVPDLEDWALHRGGPGEPLFLDERVTVRDGTRLATILGAGVLTVRSGHHQAVDRLGADLAVAAVADDGVVEAVEHRHCWAVGVQFHPEDDDGDPAVLRSLFTAFLDQVRSGRRSPTVTPR